MQLTSYERQVAPEGIDANHERQLVSRSASERIATGLVTGIFGDSKITEIFNFI